jgi:hypothetical protein
MTPLRSPIASITASHPVGMGDEDHAHVDRNGRARKIMQTKPRNLSFTAYLPRPYEGVFRPETKNRCRNVGRSVHDVMVREEVGMNEQFHHTSNLAKEMIDVRQGTPPISTASKT